MSHRTQITLSDEQYARLLAESQRSGLSLAALVRAAIDRDFHALSTDDVFLALEGSFGAWTDRDFDGEKYVADLRRGLGRRLAKR